MTSQLLNCHGNEELPWPKRDACGIVDNHMVLITIFFDKYVRTQTYQRTCVGSSVHRTVSSNVHFCTPFLPLPTVFFLRSRPSSLPVAALLSASVCVCVFPCVSAFSFAVRAAAARFVSSCAASCFQQCSVVFSAVCRAVCDGVMLLILLQISANMAMECFLSPSMAAATW